MIEIHRMFDSFTFSVDVYMKFRPFRALVLICSGPIWKQDGCFLINIIVIINIVDGCEC